MPFVNPLKPIIEERSWSVRAPRTEVARAIEEILLPYQAQVHSVTGDKVLLTMGSRFLARLVGGAVSPGRWVPLAMLVTVREEGPTTHIHVRLVDSMGFTMRIGLWPGIIRRRMADIFRALDGLERLTT